MVIHPAEEGGYWVQAPSLHGCHSQGETVEEALANIKEAIELYISVLREDGEEISSDEGVLVGWVTVEQSAIEGTGSGAG